ncbi:MULTISPECIES: hypothetical protein [Haloferacaceae]|uniref:Uncharacterized protein n=1 Tax=Halorubrum glutamatedens TaxID=2707018 RepID=A0ABD5QU88_9EURY|nr:hypothetical protein [Halobellus captivus]
MTDSSREDERKHNATTREIVSDWLWETHGIGLDGLEEELTDDPGEYSPRVVLQHTREAVESRRDAAQTMVGTESQMPKAAEQYLRGYGDALDLVVAEMRQDEDRKIMRGEDERTD